MSVKLVECPRDAMQGFHNPIPTAKKIEYINSLLEVGFDTLDCGSFVSAKAVPQLADTAEVLKNISSSGKRTKLLTIVANEQGAETACQFSNVDILGYPFSISETFQLRNTNQTIQEAEQKLKNIMQIARDAGKDVLVYLSMGFGNPYGDIWNTDLPLTWCLKLRDMGVKSINLSDTIGEAKPDDIASIFNACLSKLPEIEFGAHFHTRKDNYLLNINAAYANGCRKFDAAIMGFGGCPFASNSLTGNLPTEDLLDFLDEIGESTTVDRKAFQDAMSMASRIFI